MTTIRATCPTCGQVDLTPVQVFLCLRGEASFYRFGCPTCQSSVDKLADRKVVALLLSAGVNLGDGSPAIPSVRVEHEDLPPLTRQDLGAFRELLRDGAFLAELAEGA
jgi:hypothetical protein